MPTVTGTEVAPGGAVHANARVTVRLVASTTGEAAGYDATGNVSIEGETAILTDGAGVWTATLTANDLITPANTVYVADVRPTVGRPIRHTFSVPNGAGPYRVEDILAPTPAALTSAADAAALAAHAALATAHSHPTTTDAVQYVSRGANALDANDGLTPGTPKATVAAAIAALPGSGGLVKLGAGTYTGALTLKSHVVIDGLGPELTILTIANGANADVVKGQNFDALTGTNGSGGIVRWGIRNLTIDGNKANQTAGNHCGIRVYGYHFLIENVVVRNCKGWGIWSEWAAGNFEILGDGSESELINFKIHNNDGGGIKWKGPHDSVWKSGIVFLNGSLASLQVGVDISAGASGLHAYAVHVWGAQCHSWAWYIHNTGTGDATTIALVDCEGEGGESGQLIIGDNDCSVIGGSWFVLDASRPVKKGIVIGDGADVGGTVIVGAKILNCTTAAITYANDVGSTVVLDVYQASGTVESGTAHAASRIDIRGSGARSKFPAAVEVAGVLTGSVGVTVPAGQSFSSGDVSLYRGDANQWRTDDSFVIVRTATNAFEVWGAVQVWGLDTTNKIMALVNGSQLRGYSDQFGTLKYLIDASNGVAWFGLGTAGAPGVAFMGDTDTGLFSAGANTASLAAGGQEQLRVQEPGDGNVGLLLRRNVGGVLTLQQVSMGAADSGGAGFKVLRVAN